MGVFMKLVGLGAVIAGGSTVTLWLLFGARNVPLAAVALAGTGVLALGWIALILHAERMQRPADGRPRTVRRTTP